MNALLVWNAGRCVKAKTLPRLAYFSQTGKRAIGGGSALPEIAHALYQGNWMRKAESGSRQGLRRAKTSWRFSIMKSKVLRYAAHMRAESWG